MGEAEKAKISDKIEEIVVPTHDVTEVKRGKRIQRKKKYFPGYVLIKSEMDNDLYHLIKNLKRVSGFLGSKGIPVPVSRLLLLLLLLLLLPLLLLLLLLLLL